MNPENGVMKKVMKDTKKMNDTECDIYRGIDMSFHWFKKNNPTLEIICDEETMTQWYDFITWCYAQDGECMAEGNIEGLAEPDFDFEISPLMESAMGECDGWWCKYNIDHQQIAEEESREKCEKCEGSGYLDEDFKIECEKCEASGYDPDDEEGHWIHYGNAFEKISNSVDTSSFKKLSGIKL